jgi:hypothetical protein
VILRCDGTRAAIRAADPAGARQRGLRVLTPACRRRRSLEAGLTPARTAAKRADQWPQRVQIAGTPDEVFAVLADPDAYHHWLVGSDTSPDADLSRPRSARDLTPRRIRPVKLKDHTDLIEIDPSDRLVLSARTWPLSSAEITLLLTARGRGTEVTMIESAGDPLSRLVLNPFTEPLAHLRTVGPLRRLARRGDSDMPLAMPTHSE